MALTPTQPPAQDERNLPIVTIDIRRKDLSALDGLEPGDAVRVILEGKVVEVSQREPDMSYPGYSGMLRVEVKSANARKVDNAFAELVDED